MGDARLAALQRLLQTHADAARDGDADTLAACAAEVRQHLAGLARARPAATDVPLLQALLQQCIRTQSFLARRQQDVEGSLAALRAGAPEAAPAPPVYGAHGTLVTAAGRGPSGRLGFA